jgi:hypothetical protein
MAKSKGKKVKSKPSSKPKPRGKGNGRSKLSRSLKRLGELRWNRRPELLLGDTIPAPMHGLAPRIVLGKVWWSRTRKGAYKSTGYHCIACGVHKNDAEGRRWLEAHEVYEVDYGKQRMRYLETVPLCHYCHSYLHRGRLEAMLESGGTSQAKYVAIVQHGDQVLREAGLSARSPASKPAIGEGEWGRWRLVIGRRRYKPLYRSYEEWLKAYGKPT